MGDLIDNYGRKINYLRISVTDRCNLRCLYCMPVDGIRKINRSDILSYEEILRVVKISVNKGFSKIRLTGGEPLVRKGVIDFIHSLSEISGVQDLSLTTNGLLLKDFAGDLFNAGLCRINVSIDSLNDIKFHEITGGGNLGKVWEGIREAGKVGLSPLKINTVVMRGFNDGEVIDFAKLSIDNPYHIRFIEYMPIGRDSKWNKGNFVSSREIRERIEAFRRLRPLEPCGAGPAQMFRMDGAMGEIGFISPLSDHFCSSCSRLRLTADGKLRTCLLSDEEVNLMPFLRGDFMDSELSRLIESAILNKPEKHHLWENTFKKCSRNMSAIGG